MAVERKQGWRGRPWLGACVAGEGSERMSDGQQRSFAQEQCAHRATFIGWPHKQASQQASQSCQTTWRRSGISACKERVAADVVVSRWQHELLERLMRRHGTARHHGRLAG